MRTDQAPRSALQQFRALASRSRQRFVRLGPRARWAAAGLLVAGLAIGGYLLAVAEPVTYDWLFDGQSFPRAEMTRALVALKAADIPCLESDGRVGVPLDRRAEAVEALAKARVGPRPLDELLDEAAEPGSLWLDPRQLAHRERRFRERVAETAIRRIEGVVSATVMLNPIETGSPLRPQQKWRALVMIQTEKDTQLSSTTVQHIRNTLEGVQPGLEANGLTLQDLRTGADYSVAGHPDVEVLSKVKVREEELRERIVDQIDIDGARVLVRIDCGSQTRETRTTGRRARSDGQSAHRGDRAKPRPGNRTARPNHDPRAACPAATTSSYSAPRTPNTNPRPTTSDQSCPEPSK